MNSGTPEGDSRRSPSPDEDAAAGWLIVASSKIATKTPFRTAPQLTTLVPARHASIPQGGVHRLQREVQVRNTKPEPILPTVGGVRALSVPDETSPEPWPLLRRKAEGSNGIAH